MEFDFNNTFSPEWELYIEKQYKYVLPKTIEKDNNVLGAIFTAHVAPCHHPFKPAQKLNDTGALQTKLYYKKNTYDKWHCKNYFSLFWVLQLLRKLITNIILNTIYWFKDRVKIIKYVIQYVRECQKIWFYKE